MALQHYATRLVTLVVILVLGISLLALLTALCTVQLAAEVVDGYDNDKPFPAHKVIGNIYFVGIEGLGSFLITAQNLKSQIRLQDFR
jgi:hypothetical protein